MRHGHSRLGGAGGQSATSPPVSPRPRLGKRAFGVEKGSNLVEKLVFLVVTCVFRKKGVLLFAPVFYILGMLFFMGSFGFDVGVSIRGRGGRGERGPAPPGSVYRSPEVFRELWPFMEAEVSDSTDNALTLAWTRRSNETWMPCVSSTVPRAALPESNGFLIIEANGGLNQQRLSICDVVAVAELLNATLIIPIFHLNSVWRDSSNFADIFDEEFFIESLSNKVRVLRQLPEDVLQRYDHNISTIINLRVKAWSSPSHYLQKVLPKMKELGAVRIAPFSNRLAQAVPPHVQGLRCFANFEALRFAEYIRTLGEKMVKRMTQKSSGHEGRYVSVHLRFEKDMVAFSCCEYDGGKEEKKEMDIAREKGWRGKFRKKGRVIRPDVNRMDGKCPLTPLEVGMMLRGMGFDNMTFLYIASGKIYEEEKYMAPLKMMFPNLQTKDTLASPEELAPLQGFSSRLAAIDYTVCLHSEVFLTTQGGNFPHFLIGHRRYLFGGHANTIRPDKRKLALLFDNPKIRWEYFKRQMQEILHHSDAKGIELKKPSGSVYSFPMPDCMCKQERSNSHSQSQA